MLNTDKKELLALWLADQVTAVVVSENVAVAALKMVEKELVINKIDKI